MPEVYSTKRILALNLALYTVAFAALATFAYRELHHLELQNEMIRQFYEGQSLESIRSSLLQAGHTLEHSERYIHTAWLDHGYHISFEVQDDALSNYALNDGDTTFYGPDPEWGRGPQPPLAFTVFVIAFVPLTPLFGLCVASAFQIRSGKTMTPRPSGGWYVFSAVLTAGWIVALFYF